MDWLTFITFIKQERDERGGEKVEWISDHRGRNKSVCFGEGSQEWLNSTETWITKQMGFNPVGEMRRMCKSLHTPCTTDWGTGAGFDRWRTTSESAAARNRPEPPTPKKKSSVSLNQSEIIDFFCAFSPFGFLKHGALWLTLNTTTTTLPLTPKTSGYPDPIKSLDALHLPMGELPQVDNFKGRRNILILF